MANKRVISVNESSLVDLKAELYRKETEFKRKKIDNILPKKAPIWQKKKKESNKKHVKVAQKSCAESTVDKQLEKSRLMLEAKSALYEKLSKGEIEVPSDEDEQEGRFLVDFHQKAMPESDKNEVKNEDKDNINEMLPAKTPDEEWVDYVDSFGRSRRCLRKDLPDMKEKDTKTKLNIDQDTSLPSLLSDDMRREIIRKKWEREVEETLDKPVGPVHYQDITFEEVRDHGVGYYKFSKVEDERQQQQMTLKKLRAQTEQQRNKREKLLQKRKATMDARLAKVRERKLRTLKEQGLVKDEEDKIAEPHELPHELPHEEIKTIEEGQEQSAEEEVHMSVSDIVERIRNKSNRIEKAHLNKWEKNKINLDLFDKPKAKVTAVYDPRNERNPEFAPPSSYTTNTNGNLSVTKNKKWKNKTGKEDNTEIGHSTIMQPTTGSTLDCITASSPVSYGSHQQEDMTTNLEPQASLGSHQPRVVDNISPTLPLPPIHAYPPPPAQPFQPIPPFSSLPHFPSHLPQFPQACHQVNHGVYLLQPAPPGVDPSSMQPPPGMSSDTPGAQDYRWSTL